MRRGRTGVTGFIGLTRHCNQTSTGVSELVDGYSVGIQELIRGRQPGKIIGSNCVLSSGIRRGRWRSEPSIPETVANAPLGGAAISQTMDCSSQLALGVGNQVKGV